MTKLTGITISNFRVFPFSKNQEDNRIDLNEINIITGANSSGKGSFFKALLLLQDNWERHQLLKLDFTDKDHKLGSLKSVLNDPTQNLGFTLFFEDGISLTYEFEGDTEQKEGILKRFVLQDNGKIIFEIIKAEVTKKGGNVYDVNELDFIWFGLDITQENQLLKYESNPTDENIIWENQISAYFGEKTQNELNKLELNAKSKISDKWEEEKNRIKTTKLDDNEKQEIDNVIKSHENEVAELQNKIQEYENKITAIEEEKDEQTEQIKQIVSLKDEMMNLERQKLERVKQLAKPKLEEEKIKEINKRILEAEQDAIRIKNKGTKEQQEIDKMLAEGILKIKTETELSDLEEYNVTKEIEKNASDEKLNEIINKIRKVTNSITEVENQIEKVQTDKDRRIENLNNIRVKSVKEFNKSKQNTPVKSELEEEKLKLKIDSLTQEVEAKEDEEIEHLEEQYGSFLAEEKDIPDKLSSYVTGELNKHLHFYHKRITYLPAFRAEQRRIFALSELEENYQQAIRRFWEIDTTREKLIKKWFKKFEVGYDYLSIEDANDAGDTFRIWLINEEKRNLADMGFGISQLIPIILVCATAQEGEIISIEEPETNLHPKFQLRLAEMFIEVTQKFKAQVMLETHSEYLMLKLKNLTLETGNTDLKLDYRHVIIYYFSGGQFKSTTLDEYGNIKDESIFESGFFDVIPDLQGSLWQKQVKKVVYPIFVEGKTDKLILEKALCLFAPTLQNTTLITDTTDKGAGTNFVKDSVLSWVYNREEDAGKALAILDNDSSGIAVKKELELNEKYQGFQQKKKVKTILLPKPQWLISFYQKSIFRKEYAFEYELEHLFPASCWRHAETEKWTKKHNKDIRLNNSDEESKVAYLEKKEVTPIQQLMLFQTIKNDKKTAFAKYVCSKMDDSEEGSEEWNELKRLIKEIKKNFVIKNH